MGEFTGSQAKRFLELLGKQPTQVWMRAFKPDRRGAAEHHGIATRADRAWIDSKTANGFNLYAVIGEASSPTGKGGGVQDTDITGCPALFVEWDDGASIDQQVQRWQSLGLPEPTVMVATGGKSVHCYWALLEPINATEWKRITARLIAHCNSDKQCSNPSRVMRLPGSVYYHKKTGEASGQCRIIAAAGHRYAAADVEECLLIPQPPAKPVTAAPKAQWEPRSVDEINAAAEYIPRREPGNGTYPEDRNALCGCAAALDEAGHPDPEGAALALLGHLWPSEAEARQVLDSTTTREARSFWAIAGEHGYNLKRTTKPKTVTSSTSSPSRQQLPASLDALVMRLKDGWEEDGKPKGLSPGGLAEMLPAHSFRFNELDLRAYVETSSGWRRITDADLDSAYVLLTGKGWRIGADPVVKAIIHVARQTCIHPVREYLQQIKADPSITPYNLDDVAPKLFRARQPLHVAMVRKWLIGAVARAMDPGCQMDYCLVLQGAQGLLKSTTLKALTGADWFTSSHADNDKDFLLNVHSCWVYELAELESITGKKQSGALKNLITTATDSFRAPYGRTSERVDRQSVFCATVNKDQFLRDDTGNRRYWVVPIEGTTQLDRDAIMAARAAIWKAAVLAHEAGELPMLPKDLEALSAAQNEQFNEQDAWVGMVQAWMAGEPLHRWDPDRDPSTTLFDASAAFTSAEILYSAGLKRPDAITRADEMRLGEVLRGLGFTRDKNPTRIGGARVRCWRLAQPAQPGTTSELEVVPPSTNCAAAVLTPLAQPAQPKTSSRKLKGSRQPTAPAGTTAAPCSISFRTRGCATPPAIPRTAVLEGVYPGTTYPAQPLTGCATPDPSQNAKTDCAAAEDSNLAPFQHRFIDPSPAPIGSGADVTGDGDDPHWSPRAEGVT